MARKPRTPDPPRRVQAPKVRQKRPPAAGGGLSMPSTNVLLGVGLAAAVSLAIVLIVVLSGSAGGGDVTQSDAAKVRAAMTAAGCTFESRPADTETVHMATPDEKVSYETFPPSSGIQNSTPAILGNYRLPVDPRQALHNLEHGAIGIWYSQSISAADRTALDAFYDEDPKGVIVSPLADSYPGVRYPKHEPLGSKLALSAWTAPMARPAKGTAYLGICPSFDEEAFAAFRDTFRGKGPERQPVSEMVPGSN